MTRRAPKSEPQLPFNLPQTPAEYLDILRFRWYGVVIGVVLGAIGSQIAVRVVPEQFVSRTVVLVETDKIPDRFIPRITTAPDRLRTIHEEILSRTRIERILDDMNPYPELADAPRAEVVDMIRSRTGIGLRGREAFTVEYTDTNPERAQLMASRLASLFIEQASGDRATQAIDANDFIQKQLDETRRDLESVESRLGAIKIRNMGMLPNQLEANLATLQRFELERQSLQSQIRSSVDRRTLIERQLSLQMQMSEPEAQLVGELPTGGAAPASEPSTLGQLRQYLAMLRGRYTDEHPEVQATLARIERMEQEAPPVAPSPIEAPSVASSETEPDSLTAPVDEPTSFSADIMVTDLRAQLASANQDIRMMESQYAQLQQKISEYQARVERIPQVEQELQALERDYKLFSSYYSELLSRKLEAQTAGAVERKWQEQFSIIDPAQVPTSADYPKASLFLLAGLAAGLGAGAVGAFLLEVLDPSVKSLRELESLMPYPVLLTLPQVKGADGQRMPRRDPMPPGPPSERSAPESKLTAVS